jgi:hypothetical protein
VKPKSGRIFWSKKNSELPSKETCVFDEEGNPLYWKVMIDDVCFVCFQEKLAERLQKAMINVIAIKELSGEIKISRGGTYLVLKKVILEEEERNNENSSKRESTLT